MRWIVDKVAEEHIADVPSGERYAALWAGEGRYVVQFPEGIICGVRNLEDAKRTCEADYQRRLKGASL